MYLQSATAGYSQSIQLINMHLSLFLLQAQKDYFVALPNGIGAAFNIICLAFCFIFPAKSRSRLAGQADATANWGALRLQSIRRPPANGSAGSDGSGTRGSAAAGGFFDLTQFRWRSGGSFRIGSRVTSLRQALTRSETQELPDVATTAAALQASREADAIASGVLVKDVEGGVIPERLLIADSDAVDSNSNTSSRVDIVAAVAGTGC